MQRKHLLILIAGALFVVVLSAWWLDRTMNDRVRQALEVRVAEKIGVPVRIGEVDLGLFGGSLHIADLRIRNPEGYQGEDFLTAASVDAAFSWSSLFGSTFEISRLEISEVRASLESRRGRFNYQRILERLTAPPTKTEAPAAEGRGVRIGEVRIRPIRSTVSLNQPGLRLPPLEVEIPEIRLTELGSEEGNRMAVEQVVYHVVRAVTQGLLQKAARGSTGQWKHLLRGFESSGESPATPQDLRDTIEGVKDLFKKP